MGADWVKMRTDLYRDPKVCAMADILLDPEGELARFIHQNCQRYMTVTRNVMRNVTVGALVTVWGVMRNRGKRYGDDLRVCRMALPILDDIADLPGFGKALAAVGWVLEDENCLVFPRFFEEWNVDPHEQANRKNAERQRRYRERHRNVTVTLQSNVREEKSREEKSKKKTPLFVPPTIEQVAAYCRDRGNAIDPQVFVDHYQSNGWRVGKNPMKDWKAAVRTWEKNEGQFRNGRSKPSEKTFFSGLQEFSRQETPDDET